MSAAINFNDTPPVSAQLWRTVQIGWEHTVDDDGTLTLTLDGDGQPVPRTYKVPTHLTAGELIDRLGKLSDKQRKMVEAGGLPGLVEMSGLLLGSDTLLKIGSDPTVPTGVFIKFVESIVSGMNLNDITGGGDLPNS